MKMNKINQLRRIITLNQELLRKELRSPSCDRERVQIMIERYKRWIELNRFFEKELEFDFMLKLLDYDIPTTAVNTLRLSFLIASLKKNQR